MKKGDCVQFGTDPPQNYGSSQFKCGFMRDTVGSWQRYVLYWVSLGLQCEIGH